MSWKVNSISLESSGIFAEDDICEMDKGKKEHIGPLPTWKHQKGDKFTAMHVFLLRMFNLYSKFSLMINMNRSEMCKTA